MRPLQFLPALALIAVLAPEPVAASRSFDHDHAAWTSLLEEYVADGRVDYARWKADGTGSLDAYLSSLAAVVEADYDSWTEDRQLAYWLNAYNANMVREVLRRYPVSSVKHIGAGEFSVFKKRFIPSPGLEGRKLSLDAIENEIIRERWGDARIHFALVCAASSCPELREEAYRGVDLDTQLDDQGRRFLGDRDRNRYNPGTGKLYLSKIFDWFKGDFRRAAGSTKAFVLPYLPDDARAALERGEARISFLRYDWSLNDR